MPITENNFTAAELQTALKATPDLMKVVKETLAGGDYKMVVHTPDEHTTYLKNYEENVVSKKTSDHATKLEKDIKELTGIDKKTPDEKYYDYFKRAVTEKLSAYSNLEKELSDLKAKGGNTSEADKGRIKQLEEALDKTKKEWSDKLAAKTGEVSDLRKEYRLKEIVAELRASYKKEIPQSVAEIMEKAVIDQTKKEMAFQEDGAETLIDPAKNNEVILDPTTYKPLAVAAKVKERLKDLIDTGRQQTGAGTAAATQAQQQAAPGQQQQGQPGANGAKGYAFKLPAAQTFQSPPADVKTKVALGDHLAHLGIPKGTEDWDQLMSTHGEKMPLR